MEKSESVRRASESQNAHPDYVLYKSQTLFIGTWDDHDYTFNNAAGDLTLKKTLQCSERSSGNG